MTGMKEFDAVFGRNTGLGSIQPKRKFGSRKYKGQFGDIIIIERNFTRFTGAFGG